jgi:hypothetical protein
MFLMQADTLREEVLREEVGGGWALEISSFLGPVKWYRADRRMPFMCFYILIYHSFLKS